MTSDATSRYAPASAGVLICWLPYLLRGNRFLGRWGALATSALLLISPTILYQSRYIRHDVYTVAGVLLMFICLVRYIDTPERKWLVTFLATTALMLANHEVIFAQSSCFSASSSTGRSCSIALRHWWHEQRDLVMGDDRPTRLCRDRAGRISSCSCRTDTWIACWRYRGTAMARTRCRRPAKTRSNYYQDMASNWLVIGLLLVAAYLHRRAGLPAAIVQAASRESGEGWLDDAHDRSPTAAIRAIVADWPEVW